jgi:hypothetical protein
MGMIYKTGVKAHDDAVALAEGVRQVTCAPGASAATIKSAEITFYRAVVSSCRANNNGSGIEQPLVALRELGVGQ